MAQTTLNIYAADQIFKYVHAHLQGKARLTFIGKAYFVALPALLWV
jgi:hypothetical protein